MTEYQEGDVVWFVHRYKLEMYEGVIQEVVDGYYYTFINDNGRTLVQPIHEDNLQPDERSAKKELFKLRLQKEKHENLRG